MAFSRPEAKRFNPHIIPEDTSFRTWLQEDPHFAQVARPDIPSTQRVIRLLSLEKPFADIYPDRPLDHAARLALTIRFISERYKTVEDIFEIFGVNRRTQSMFISLTYSPHLTRYNDRLHELLAEMGQRRQHRTKQKGEKKDVKVEKIAVPVPTEEVVLV